MLLETEEPQILSPFESYMDILNTIESTQLMNVSKLTNAGWTATIGLEEGIKAVYEGLKDKEWY